MVSHGSCILKIVHYLSNTNVLSNQGVILLNSDVIYPSHELEKK